MNKITAYEVCVCVCVCVYKHQRLQGQARCYTAGHSCTRSIHSGRAQGFTELIHGSKLKKGAAEDEMVGWHHWLSGHEFEQTLGDGEGQGSLVCGCPRGLKESDTTEQQMCPGACRAQCLLCSTQQIPETGSLPKFTERESDGARLLASKVTLSQKLSLNLERMSQVTPPTGIQVRDSPLGQKPRSWPSSEHH